MHYDVAIIGAGPAGLALTRRLHDSGLSIALLEQNTERAITEPPVDGRDIALTHLSVSLLKQLGVWQQIPQDKVSPIREARVVEGDSPYSLSFDCVGERYDALGFLLSNHLIRKGLFDVAVQNPGLTLKTSTRVLRIATNERGGCLELSDGTEMHASLIVGADTRFSETRRQMGIAADMHDFGRVAIVCWMQHELPHRNIALECFHYGRTLAVLPMPGNTSSIVITVPANQASDILRLDPAEFAADVMQRLKNSLGSMQLESERFSYPLVAVHARRFYARRYALIGDAAVGMHPVTAHGFNLGLSSADLLGEELLKALHKGLDVADESALKRYQLRHMLVSRPLFAGTNQIVNLFTNDTLAAKLLRKAALRVSNHLPPVKWAIKQKLTSQSRGYGMLMPFLGS